MGIPKEKETPKEKEKGLLIGLFMCFFYDLKMTVDLLLSLKWRVDLFLDTHLDSRSILECI